MNPSKLQSLLEKYDIPAPRYTSYPTVPYWETSPTPEAWLGHLRNAFSKNSMKWSMYLHIPFCESLCTFCGCNTIITKNHDKESPYVNHLLGELEIYLREVPEISKKEMKHIHLGGGTPTFLAPGELDRMLSGIFKNIKFQQKEFEASIEVDPRRTTTEQLSVLRNLGFNRVSLGVQDFHPEVQRLVNRIQPFAITQKITDESRRLGFTSVNFDLIYGLAMQTPESMKETAKKTIELLPDRIALYSFAMVPWIKPAQRLFRDEDLPVGAAKRLLYEIAREELLGAGYIEIGMDHFALPTDTLSIAAKNGELHRNFMGYTDQKTDVLLGLGVSSISESPESFHQNEKVLPVYEQKITSGNLATFRGHIHTSEDVLCRNQILELMTKFEVDFLNEEQAESAKAFLSEMIQDGLVSISDRRLKVSEHGRPFLRNACLFFDSRLRRKQPQTQIFSRSI